MDRQFGSSESSKAEVKVLAVATFSPKSWGSLPRSLVVSLIHFLCL